MSPSVPLETVLTVLLEESRALRVDACHVVGSAHSHKN